MKKVDLLVCTIVVLVLLPFFLFSSVSNGYTWMNDNHPYIMAFSKFAVLATFGEMLALRIRSGVYYKPHFGVFPKMIIWGLLGVWIALAMKIFAAGVPIIVEKIGVNGLTVAMTQPFSGWKLLGAFCISVMMNTSFAPVFMTIHKITDTHIQQYQGSMKSLIIPVDVKNSITKLDWQRQWNFVFKKTIPLFWIPAHTLTFILPVEYQVLFAALLSIALGLILAFASLSTSK